MGEELGLEGWDIKVGDSELWDSGLRVEGGGRCPRSEGSSSSAADSDAFAPVHLVVSQLTGGI